MLILVRDFSYFCKKLKHMKHQLILLAVATHALLSAPVVQANPENKKHTQIRSEENAPVCLFKTPDPNGIPYRIPAIATSKNGNILALSDYRYCGADIGFGQIDIVGRISKDNGRTWSPQFDVVKGNGIKQDHACGYGDAAIVADRKKNEILLMCCTGNVTYWNSKRDNPLRVARLYSKDGGMTWTEPEDITENIYGLFDQRTDNGLDKLFVGSGKICQSTKIKKGKYYRIYAALCTGKGNYVIYSDDFGQQWQVLGDINQSPAPQGDEPKCEELPDGSVLLSSRKSYGRFFNIYKYSKVKDGQGSWGKPVASHECTGGIKTGANATNGEVAVVAVKRNSDGKKMHLILQSLPTADNRANVSIFYKGLEDEADYNTPQSLASNWEGSYQVSHTGSAYSTFCIQPDKRIAFLYEEEPGYYNLIYQALDLEEITKGAYKMR